MYFETAKACKNPDKNFEPPGQLQGISLAQTKKKLRFNKFFPKLKTFCSKMGKIRCSLPVFYLKLLWHTLCCN